ncbi:MAG: hypothetical protein H7A51_17495 [Akkermansiaceae bacterium]|nr:hypothetical protein [Akkermansiaceae bacterium]
MKPPPWKSCTEEELWKYVAFHLEKNGIESVLVGGAGNHAITLIKLSSYAFGNLKKSIGSRLNSGAKMKRIPKSSRR